MAENKKSFTAYCDWNSTFNSLPDDKAGQLIKHLFAYVNDENPISNDLLINAVFANIKATLKRDLVKWNEKSVKNRETALSRWNKNNANVCERIKVDAKHADSVSDSVSDSVNVNDKENKISQILNFFNFSIENQNHIKQQRLVLAFLTTLKDESYFLTQFEAYKKIKEKEPEFKHSINSFIGTQSNKFEDGKWQDVNWVEKLATVKAKPKEIVYFSQAEKNAIERRKLKNL